MIRESEAAAATRLRIIYLSRTGIPGLTAHSMHVMKMCQAIAQEGHEIELVAHRPTRKLLGPRQTVFDHHGIRDRFPIRLLRLIRGLGGFDYDIRALLIIMKGRPDLVYTRNLRGAALLSMLGLPVTYEAHGIPQGRLGAWYFRRVLSGRRLRGVVAISYGLMRELASRFSRQLAAPLIVAHDGVDLERFHTLPRPEEARSALGLPPPLFTVGYAGHLYPGRGIGLILELARRCVNIQFLLVGGAPAVVEEHRQGARRTGLTNVRWVGFVPNSELPKYLAACEVLLMPYQRRVSVSGGAGDTSAIMSPMKMFEYMAAGRLIISSDLPVLREVLDETNAVLCDPEDLDAWHTAVLHAQREPDTRKRLADRARSDAEKYAWRNRVRHVLVAAP